MLTLKHTSRIDTTYNMSNQTNHNYSNNTLTDTIFIRKHDKTYIVVSFIITVVYVCISISIRLNYKAEFRSEFSWLKRSSLPSFESSGVTVLCQLSSLWFQGLYCAKFIFTTVVLFLFWRNQSSAFVAK